MNYMRQEILQQPDIIANLLNNEKKRLFNIAQEVMKRNPKFMVIVARGTSDNAARYAKYLFGTHLGLQVALATPSVYTLYKKPVNMHDAVVVGISQSGQSEGAIAVLNEARKQGAPTIAITNNPQSLLASNADYVLETHAGPELSIPATKTYTSQLTVLAMLGAGFMNDSGMIAELKKVPELINKVIKAEENIRELALNYRYAEFCTVFGRGYNYATAFEISLKLKETCYLTAEPYSPADYQHGPIALMEEGSPTIIIAPSGASLDNMIRFTTLLLEHKASILMISDSQEALSIAELPCPLPPIPAEWISPIVAVVPGQLLALNLVTAKKLDPDKPRGLKKITRDE